MSVFSLLSQAKRSRHVGDHPDLSVKWPLITLKCNVTRAAEKWDLPVAFSLFPVTAISICYISDNMNVYSYCGDNEMTCI